jgi:hypothetical protein
LRGLLFYYRSQPRDCVFQFRDPLLLLLEFIGHGLRVGAFGTAYLQGSGPPQRAADCICGEPLAFLIEINDQRVYIDSGGTPAQLPPKERVDLAILGMALPDSRARLAASLERLQPRYILPSHQDNFFLPLSEGFQFGPLTDFPRVQRDCARENRGRLILLDYFRPWTLPLARQ